MGEPGQILSGSPNPTSLQQSHQHASPQSDVHMIVFRCNELLLFCGWTRMQSDRAEHAYCGMIHHRLPAARVNLAHSPAAFCDCKPAPNQLQF